MKIRRSGVLLHLTSLPSRFGIGDMGPAAHKFVGMLNTARQHYWQILPLSPVDPLISFSPYNSKSVLAGNDLVISPVEMVSDGWLDQSDIENPPSFEPGIVEYQKVKDYKRGLFQKAFRRMREMEYYPDLDVFRSENAHWLEDYALFEALKAHFGQKVPWNKWPADYRDRDPSHIESIANELKDSVDLEIFIQFLFFSQWGRLKALCKKSSIQVIGDMAIYVHMDSVDVWMYPQFFKLDKDKLPLFVSGVPPDYFSETGQLWGNPVYNWEAMREAKYSWWMRRLDQAFKIYDIVRIDHFRGLAKYWEVKAGEPTALNGQWVDGPGNDLFDALLERFAALPLIAEDLGVITPDVKELMNAYSLPGLKVLQFAFGEDMPRNPFIPHNIPGNSIVYTGTHDNNTCKGWYSTSAKEDEIKRLAEYIGDGISEENVNWRMIRLAMMSPGNTAIVLVQDLLGLDDRARINDPSKVEGNWIWRMTDPEWEILQGQPFDRLKEMTVTYGRAL